MRAPFKSGITAGTTGANYAEALRVDTRGCGIQGKLLALINNTMAATTPMYYKIDGYPADVDGTAGGKSVAIKSETSIAANTQVVSVDVDKPYAAVVISVKSNGSTPATWQIDHCTY